MLHGHFPSKSNIVQAEVKKTTDYRLYLLPNNNSNSMKKVQKLVLGGNGVLLYPDPADKTHAAARKYNACFIQKGSLYVNLESKVVEVIMGNRIIRSNKVSPPCDITTEPYAENLIKAALARAGIMLAPVLKIPPRVFRAYQVANLDAKSLASFACTSFYANKLINQSSTADQRAVKKLIDHVLCGEIDNVKKILKVTPHLALVKYEATKEAEKVVTNKGNQRIQIHGKTAYQIALGEEDGEMAEKLKAYIIQGADEKEANAQYNAQYPEGWEKEEEKRWAPLFAQLEKLTEVIRTHPEDIKSSGEPEFKLKISEESVVDQALARYRKTWNAILNEPVTTGRHYNPNFLQQTFQLYDDHFEDYFGNAWNDPRAMCFWQRVIGYAQRSMPANYVQAFCERLNDTTAKLLTRQPQGRLFNLELHDVSKRKWISGDFYSLAVSSELGFDFAIYRSPSWVGGGEVSVSALGLSGMVYVCVAGGAISKFMPIKNCGITELETS